MTAIWWIRRDLRLTDSLALAQIAWREDKTDFASWKAGLTGVPVVDAVMCQLRETGWMQNRARMIVASAAP